MKQLSFGFGSRERSPRPSSPSPRPTAIRGAPGGYRRRGGIQEDLSRALAERGEVIHATAITKIEKGTRGVSVDEVLSFAAALDVAPVHLLVPIDDAEAVEITPGFEVPAPVARRWFRGQHPLPFQDARAYVTQVPKREFDLAERTSFRWIRDYIEGLPYRSDIPDDQTMLTDVRDLADGLLNPRYIGAEELIRQQQERKGK